MSIRSLRRFARYLCDGAAWKPSNITLLSRQVFDRCRNQRKGYTDHDHLLAAAQWLCRAQDVSSDGGVSGRYRLREGWSSSYPETTGYIIPTFLALKHELGDRSYEERARRCVEFLISVQLPDGAFPSGEIASKRTEASVFNSAQIIDGLRSWHAATGDATALNAALRAANWLLSVQEDDGAFRRHCYLDLVNTYSAYATCWLAELGRYQKDARFLDAAGRHLDWVLCHQDVETGWIDLCGFDQGDHAARRALTHTIGYTLSGILRTSTILKRADGLQAVGKAADALLRRLELSRWMPGALNHRWQAEAQFACLTGNAQLALLWFDLYKLNNDARYLNAAFKILDIVKNAQPMTSRNPNIRGGIAGSDPVWGNYICMTIPNWPAKFFVDALIAKKAALAALPERPQGGWQLPDDVPTRIPSAAAQESVTRPKVVMYTGEESTKVAEMVERWSAWNFKPDYVVVETTSAQSVTMRLRKRIREEGFGVFPSGPLDLLPFLALDYPPLLRVPSFHGIDDRVATLVLAGATGLLRAAHLTAPDDASTCHSSLLTSPLRNCCLRNCCLVHGQVVGERYICSCSAPFVRTAGFEPGGPCQQD